MPKAKKTGPEPEPKKPHTRNLRQLRITVLPEDEAMLKDLAREIQRPGIQPNLSEAARVVFAEWRAGRKRKATATEVKRGRKASKTDT